ncbi:FHA domain-containing protein [Microbacterium sp. EYE_5]|uniref:DUF5684 domain-containing protein n=1 Tax=unclassified Microbacterium TaxID=2609290 RepID=UPI002006C8CD|nr:MULTISPECIES: DUF5684 domain-containing protein [unclassified Microbacterium]MCK6079120.1 FHA domain-containing protein [Microbacterium sp. EYE_382]MCK6084390.1 FHA domain-containing protein [Microbacterium sp. EYE_384]MCK6123381.1 FHA domain-containing protein [Microbacterium sp. EYE_80]MCK6125154.1 FHA domain-containing protein [Microbacterium sp. EYE_79]MCK6140074.1 FHA domain-containing protein [Microbacterium sp. EYE_39]
MSVGVDSGAGVVLGLLAFILSVAVYVWIALALSATFRKMGEEPWRAWVPFLNVATILRWGGLSPWLVLFALVPGVGPIAVWVLVVIAVNRINPGFGYGTGLTVLAAFLFPVWATLVGFGPAQWRGARPARPVPAAPGTAPGVSHVLPPLPPPGLDEATSRASVFAAPASPADQRAAADPPAAGPSVAAQPWAPPSAPAERPVSAAPSIPSPAAPDADEQPDPTAPTPTVRPESAWQSDMDEVSAVSPAPFPPSAASGARPSVSPPVAAGESGIISSVPGREGHDAPVTRLRPPVAPTDRDDRDVFPELTGEVSAVVGSPAAGAPVAATSSVSAQEREREERAAAAAQAPADEDLERTVIVRRGRVRWELVPPAGTPVPLTADVVIIGRNPAADPSRPHAQLVPIADATRTVSKTHARLERRGDVWHITDLDSTNGVLLPSLLGTDIEVESGTDAELAERFLLGDASLRIQRVDPGA